MTPPNTPATEVKDLIEIIVSNLPRMTNVAIEPETELRALGMDCVSLSGVAIDIEDRTGRRVSDAEIETWATVGDVARVLGEGLS
jgi:acyl carrier protein